MNASWTNFAARFAAFSRRAANHRLCARRRVVMKRRAPSAASPFNDLKKRVRRKSKSWKNRRTKLIKFSSAP